MMTSFGPFRFDAPNQRLYCGAVDKRLSRKAASVLECLIKSPNELVSHAQLLDSVWQGVHVQPEVLKVYIAELRRALGDPADKPRYIKTVHRQGYRFIQPSQLPKIAKPRRIVSEPLIGRDREIDFLMKLLRKTAKGRRQVVFITGEGGMGKTTLLNTFLRRVERRPGVCTALGQVARAQGENESFSALLNALTGVISDGNEELLVALRKYAPGWLLQLPSLLDPADVPRLNKEMAGASSQRMIREFTEALDSYCSTSLLILGLDDLHRADQLTLDLLEFLASRTGSAKLLVIATVGDAAGAEPAHALVARLQARQLSEEVKLKLFAKQDVREFLDVTYPPSAVGRQLSRRLHQLSGGMPLFLCSAARYLEEKQWILKTGQGWIPCAETIGNTDLAPPVLKELIELKLRLLSLDDQRILEAASISGVEFSIDFLTHALDEPAVTMEEACSRLVRQGSWLQSAGFTPMMDGGVSPKFRFRHELFREVLYGRQSAMERVRRHKRVAVALESASTNHARVSAHELALHFAAGQECSKSLQYLRAAAADAQCRYSGAEAVALLTQALSLSGHLTRGIRPVTELEMLCELAAAYFSCGDFENASMTWHKALRKAVKCERIDTAISVLSSLAFPVGWDNPARLRSAANRVLALVDRIDDPVARSEVTIRALALCNIAGISNTNHSVIAADSLRLVLDQGDKDRIASTRIASSFLRLRHSEYGAVIEDLEQSIPIAMDHSDVVDVIHAEWLLSWALLHDGQLGRMQSVAVAAADHASRNGNHRIEAIFLSLLAWLHVECGDCKSAQNLSVRALELHSSGSRAIGMAGSHVIAGMAAAGLDDNDTALDYIDRASLEDLPPEHLWRFMGDIVALRVHLASHNHAEAHRLQRRLSQTAEKVTEKTWKAVALSTCAKAAAESNQLDLARTYTDAALKLVNGDKLPLAKWRIEAVSAELLRSESRKEAAEFKQQSRKSRTLLFSSMDARDPLRRFARESN